VHSLIVAMLTGPSLSGAHLSRELMRHNAIALRFWHGPRKSQNPSPTEYRSAFFGCRVRPVERHRIRLSRPLSTPRKKPAGFDRAAFGRPTASRDKSATIVASPTRAGRRRLTPSRSNRLAKTCVRRTVGDSAKFYGCIGPRCNSSTFCGSVVGT